MNEKIQNIAISDYNYPLPDERIARYPLAQRDQSKLLFYKKGEIETSRFDHLPDLLPEQTLLVFNNTKVIHARLRFQKETGAVIEVFCLEPYRPVDYALSLSSKEGCSWLCMVGNMKRWKSEPLTMKITLPDGSELVLTAQKGEPVGTAFEIHFSWNRSDITFAELLQEVGELPIPPYLNRATEQGDEESYQTIYAKQEGSVAAPTAGLHFTDKVMNQLMDKGIQMQELTLHVGAGTFKPVKSETIGKHDMHTEHIEISAELIRSLIKHRGHIIAVGTTSTRTLETLYFLGCMVHENPDISQNQLHVQQWYAYEHPCDLTMEQSLESLLTYMQRNNLTKLFSSTQIIIAPGYTFRVVSGLITNFHQPQSTLLLLVSAFVHGQWRKIYDYALEGDFRFLSFGDSSLLLP